MSADETAGAKIILDLQATCSNSKVSRECSVRRRIEAAQTAERLLELQAKMFVNEALTNAVVGATAKIFQTENQDK